MIFQAPQSLNYLNLSEIQTMVWLARPHSVKVSEYVKFPMKFSSDSLQIFYMDWLYHTYQYVCVFKLIWFIIFWILGCFFIVLQKNV